MAESYRRESHCQADFRKNGNRASNLILIPNQRTLRREESGRAARGVAFFAIRQSRVWLASSSNRTYCRLVLHLDTADRDS